MYDDGVQSMRTHYIKVEGAIPSDMIQDLSPPYINGTALDIVSLISSMNTQWNYLSTSMSVIKKGLDYTALEVVSRLKDIPITPTMFDIIRELEIFILKIEKD